MARQIILDAQQTVSRRIRLSNAVTKGLVAIGSCLVALALFAAVGQVGPAPLVPLIFPDLAKQPLATYLILLVPVIVVGLKVGLYARDPAMNVRRWEIESGAILLTAHQLAVLRATLTGEDTASVTFRNWEAHGLLLRQRDARWLIEQRTTEGQPIPSIELCEFSYIVDGVLQPAGAPV